MSQTVCLTVEVVCVLQIFQWFLTSVSERAAVRMPLRNIKNKNLINNLLLDKYIYIYAYVFAKNSVDPVDSDSLLVCRLAHLYCDEYYVLLMTPSISGKPPFVGLSPQFSFTGEGGVEKVLALCFPVPWVQTADIHIITCSP